jgi:hypothetical protein
VTFGAIDGIDVRSRIDAITSEKAEAARMEADVAAKTSALVKELVAQDVPLRDIGAMLGLSFQRIHQLAAA